jgi:pimeloyl-ACP methyl ester carboxylesterase
LLRNGGFILGATFSTLSAQDAWRDPSPHHIQMVKADTSVRLEVLDWGGQGRPLVLLAGLGNTAHIFDDFAPKLARNYHVYGITRRGFGVSSVPANGYGADRLGDDVLAVLEGLHLAAPVLGGHSIAGEELSSIASRHPDRVAGLVYLDAAHPYAFDNGKGWSLEDNLEMMKSIPRPPPPAKTDMASPAAFAAWFRRTRGVSLPEGEAHELLTHNFPRKVAQAILDGSRKFTDIRVATLAICAHPQDMSAELRSYDEPELRAEVEALRASVEGKIEKQIAAFKDGVPSARVVILPNAHHYIFLSNESDVLREMKAFLAMLH